MLANKLFPLLGKPEVQEVILLSGKPPVAVVNGSYRRLSAQILQDEDIMAVIMSAQGQEHALQLADGVEWSFVAPGVGKVSVAARYDGPNLRMTLRLAGLSVQNIPAVQPATEQPLTAAEPASPRARAARSEDSSSAHRAVTPEAQRRQESPPRDAQARAHNDDSLARDPRGRGRSHDSAQNTPAQSRGARERGGDSSQNLAAQPRVSGGRAQSEDASQNLAARPRSGSSQNISAQPNTVAAALDLDSIAPAARLKSSQQRTRDAQEPPRRVRPPAPEPEAFDPSLRDDINLRVDAIQRDALEPPLAAAHEPFGRDAQEPLARDLPFREGRDSLAEPPPFADTTSFQAQRSANRAHRLDSIDEPPAPPPRAAPNKARARSTGNSDALDVLFDRARELHASDLHVLADRPATLRIAGDLVPQPESFDPATLEQLLLPRVPAGARALLDRDGSCDFALVHPEHGRFRANVGRQRTGLKLTARPISDSIPGLAELGLPSSIESALEHHQGLIVITGPTGHGKTTTLAALTGILNRETSHHVITVEDPIEYVHSTAKAVISQREVGTHTKTFAAALKGSLREDPDVIVVGELRDTETVRMALSASETGHLVISTMNTPSAAKAIERLIDLFPPGDQPQVRMTLAGGLRLIISQRLVPSADRKQLVAACEVLPGSTPLWALIRENRTYQIASLQQRGKSIGIIRMDDSLADLVKSGKTSLEIAREYADSTELLSTLIQGRAQPVRAEQQTPENQNDPDNSLQKRGVELGKQVLSRAGKLFGGENK